MPLNAILAALLKEFSESQELNDTPEFEQFEHFVNYSILSEVYGGDFNPVDVSTGNQEFGLDGVAIIVNGVMVEDIDEINDLADRNKFLEVDFVFTQAKTAAAFDSGDMLKTLFAVQDFFGALALLQGPVVKDRKDIKDYLYSRAALFRRAAPRLSIFYVSAGAWKGDPNLEAVIDQNLDKLRATGLFSDVRFTAVDAPRIQQLYFRTKNAVRRQIVFDKSVTLPAIDGVREAHLGYLPAAEYMKLIEDESGGIKKQLFFDNMRDFMEGSQTNKEISDTLTSERSAEFPLRNNGVTIVARKLHRVGNSFDIEDYQIVNGCQTSHVLFNNKDKLKDNIVVPTKIIVSEEDDVINKIIRGSNFSNQFDKSQLWATEPFHKDLEIFFANHFEGDLKLYYERRKGQFGSGGQIEKVRIVTPQALLKHSASIYLERPHDVTKYYSSLEPEVGKTLFVQGQNPFVYHAAAFASFRLESLFRNRYLAPEYKPVRHHLLMGLKLSTVAGPVDLHDKGAQKKIEPMMKVLSDQGASAARFAELISIVDDIFKASGADTMRQLAKSVTLRDGLRHSAPQLS